MKYKSLKIILILICLSIFSLTQIKAQQNFNPPEIISSYSQIYKELKIEITGIKRVREYQGYFPKTTRSRGPKLVAQDGQEIAIIQIHTSNLSEKERNGFRLHGVSVFDSEGTKYESNQSGPAIGSVGDAHNQIYKENDFELAVNVPLGTKFSAVQLNRTIYRDTQPYVVIQKITFDIGSLGL